MRAVGQPKYIFPAHLRQLVSRKREPLLHDLFECSAIQYPDAIAVDDMERGVSWTYAELRQKSIYLSHLIRSMGVVSEDYVGVLLPRGGDFYWCMLAILRAGGAYVSLDPEYPKERIEATVQDSRAKLILTEDDLVSQAEEAGGCAPPASVDCYKSLMEWVASVPADKPKILKRSLWANIFITSPSTILPPVQLTAGSPCYAIFTSGSTGRPKGVCIEHRSAVNFVLGEQRCFPTSHTDRVLQGFSTSFDASVEEIWLAFASGATLVVGTKTTMRSGPSLGRVLGKMGITVFSTVPTVLRLVEEIPAPPLLRIVITGGEACPPEVVHKWSHPDRQLLNTYGPTEAAVVATYRELKPNVPVTIGKPLPGYSAHIVNPETKAICGIGEPGELWLGGVSVARGYINREDLNAEKFPIDGVGAPLSNWEEILSAGEISTAADSDSNGKETDMEKSSMDSVTPSRATSVIHSSSGGSVAPSRSTSSSATSQLSSTSRVYRTGDLVQWNADGEIEFLGRIDSQVKIRGFRVELSEIESAIMRFPNIGNICVIVRTDCANKGGDATKQQTLCCYIEPKEDSDKSEFTPNALRDHAASILPDYMVPQRYIILESIKLSPSGKVDRKALEQMPPPSADCAPNGGSRTEDAVPLEGPTEEVIAKLFRDVLGMDLVGATDDFFKLGGTSLSAAQFISGLRKICPAVPTATADLYNCKTVRDLAKVVESQCEENEIDPPALPKENLTAEERRQAAEAASVPPKSTKWYYYFTWAAQFIVWVLIGGSFASWAAAGIHMTSLVLEGRPLWYLFVTWPVFALGSMIGYVCVAIVLKWILLGKVKEGEHELWGWYYLRWWIVDTVGLPIQFFAATPMAPFFMRFLGAKIGRNVHIASGFVKCSDLLTIEDNVVIQVAAQVCCAEVDNGKLKLAKIHIGAGSIIGFRSALKLGTSMGHNSELGDLASLMTGQHLPAGEKWIGAPARLETDGEICPVLIHAFDPSEPHKAVSVIRQIFFTFSWLVCWYVLAVALFAPVASGLWFTLTYGFASGCAWSPLFVTAGLFSFLSFTIIVKWLTVGKITPGDRPLYGFFYLRWLMNYNMQQLTVLVMHPFYSTMFTRTYLNLLGAKLGKRVEISDAREWTPDMIEIDDDCFVADFVGLGGWRVDKSRRMHLDKVKVGAKTFLGNNACIPGGTTLPSDALLGVYTLAPKNAEQGGSYLGSPPFPLANRTVVKNAGDRLTFCPPWYLYPIRGTIEFIRTIAPAVIATEAFMLSWYVGQMMIGSFGLYYAILASPLLFCLYGLQCATLAIIMKYLLVGDYSTKQAPLWSTFVWRAELSTALEEDLAFASFIRTLVGTPFLAVWFRCLGAKIGKRVYLNSAHLTEPDLISIGDDCCLNGDVTVQGHLFEDRIMKMDKIEIGQQCSIGTRAVILYTSKMGDGSSLGAMSLMMKGEEYPARSSFAGLPAAPLRYLKKNASHGAKEEWVDDSEAERHCAPPSHIRPLYVEKCGNTQQPAATPHAVVVMSLSDEAI